MNFFVEIAVPLLTGGLIGYVTNEVAIKMLFRPRKAVYIKNYRLPFTPGLIPKEKQRIANSIGRIVSENILNSDVVSQVLSSEAMIEKLRESIDSFIEKNRYNEMTVEDFLQNIFPNRASDIFIEEMKKESAAMLYNEIVKARPGEMITEILFQKLRDGKKAIFPNLFTNVFNDKLIAVILKTISEQTDKIINENSEDIINSILDDRIESVKNMQIGRVIDKYYNKKDEITEIIIDIYKKGICENTENILAGLNIEKIIEERISSFDTDELENMIFGIMSKELKAIVYLGAFLGLIMGVINIII